MKRLKVRFYAGICTLILLALVDSNLSPTLWQVGFCAIGIYEGFAYLIQALVWHFQRPVDGRYRKCKPWHKERIGRAS